METALEKPPILDKAEMLSVLKEINAFTETPAFVALLQELRDQPTLADRRLFVRDVVINKEELHKRGINPPDAIRVQRSYFTDDRPTLFCVVKYLKDGKRKMTLTYDDASDGFA